MIMRVRGTGGNASSTSAERPEAKNVREGYDWEGGGPGK